MYFDNSSTIRLLQFEFFYLLFYNFYIRIKKKNSQITVQTCMQWLAMYLQKYIHWRHSSTFVNRDAKLYANQFFIQTHIFVTLWLGYGQFEYLRFCCFGGTYSFFYSPFPSGWPLFSLSLTIIFAAPRTTMPPYFQKKKLLFLAPSEQATRYDIGLRTKYILTRH